VEKIRQRWKSVRDSYVKYINKTRDKTGSKVRPYKFEKQLKFLKPFLAGQKDGVVQFNDDSHSESADQALLTTVDPCTEESSESKRYTFFVFTHSTMFKIKYRNQFRLTRLGHLISRIRNVCREEI
jgi:hypothetical protein